MKVVILVLGFFLVFAGLSAKTVELTSFKLDTVPTAIKVVEPSVSKEYANTHVTLEFVVNEDGKVEGAKTLSDSEVELSKTLIEAVSKWEFIPAKKDGLAVATKVRLPVFIK